MIIDCIVSEGEISLRGSNGEESINSRSRGMSCPGFARLLAPLLSKRAREGRASAGARDPWAKNAHGVVARQPDQPGPPARWFEQRLVLCLVSEAAVAAVTFGLPGGIESPVESMRHHKA